MGWTNMKTWVSELFTAADVNTYLGANITDLHRRTTLHWEQVVTSESTTSTTYTNLATVGPAVTNVEVGQSGRVLITLTSSLSHASGGICVMGYEFSGATTGSASDSFALSGSSPAGLRMSATYVQASLNPGMHTFTAKYRTNGGTATFAGRNIIVLPLSA